MLKNFISKAQFRRRGKQLLVLLGIAFVANHLTNEKHFPFNESYRFPLYGILTSLVLGFIILVITEVTYTYFLRTVFKKRVTLRRGLYFLLTCLGVITTIYIPIFYIAARINGDDFNLYALILGLLITLAICAILITAVYALEIYTLYKNQLNQGTLVVRNGNRKKMVTIKNIAYGYSVRKIVYLVEDNGAINATYFTLQSVEEKLASYGFFRASRNVLINHRAVKEIKSIENGKVAVLLKPDFLEQEQLKIVVSRYKKKDFMQWFENTGAIGPTIEA